MNVMLPWLLLNEKSSNSSSANRDLMLLMSMQERVKIKILRFNSQEPDRKVSVKTLSESFVINLRIE